MEEKKFYKFFRNDRCEFFPCHNVDNTEDFNCLFCYCPLYTLGSKCGGNFTYNNSGTKDCSSCLIPHTEKGFDFIMSKWKLIDTLTKENKL